MAANAQKPKIRFRFKQAGTLTKIAVVTAIALSATALVTLRLTQWDLQDRSNSLLQQAAALEQRNSSLLDAIDALGTVNGIREIARNELGLVDPGSIVFHNHNQ